MNPVSALSQTQRTNADRFKDRNVAGADVVHDRLKDLHVQTPSDEPVV